MVDWRNNRLTALEHRLGSDNSALISFGVSSFFSLSVLMTVFSLSVRLGDVFLDFKKYMFMMAHRFIV